VSINRVPEVPFAQIANAALRDHRLSFKARGILAMVLSNVGEWEATADWIEKQSERDGIRAVQSALNELTDLGYRRVMYEHDHEHRQVRTVVEWYHCPTDSTDISCSAQNVGGTKREGHKIAGAIEHYSLEHHDLEQQKRTLVRKPVDDDPGFAAFWDAYPRKSAKGSARRAWSKAITRVSVDTIIAGAARYASDPNREDAFTAHPATWLNAERWDDPMLPARDSRSGRKVSEVEDVIRRAQMRDISGEMKAVEG
jgi:hypothetical protein